MVIDAVTWFAEEDMFRLRLDMLQDVVDLFVVVEADVTHQGDSKPWGFPQDLRDHPKVRWVQASLTAATPWGRENEQRRAMKDAVALYATENDVVVFSDCDEIWDARFVDDLTSVQAARMDFRIFSIYWRYETDWPGSIGGLWQHMKQADWQDLRNRRYELPYKMSGWHLSWMGDDDARTVKQQSFAHLEFRESDMADAVRSVRWLNGKQMLETTDGLSDILIQAVPDCWKNKRVI